MGERPTVDLVNRWSLTDRIQEQLVFWPERVPETLDLTESEAVATPEVPEGGEILLFVHGFLGQGRIELLNVSGANQAAALREALAEEYETRAGSLPTVVAARWHSSTTWTRAKAHAGSAGTTLASWLQTRADSYESITVLGHSLGARVSLAALNELDGTTVDSVGLLGAAVQPASIGTEYRHGIESGVDRGVFNYYSQNDAVVCRFYGLAEGQAGLGCWGLDRPEDRLPADVLREYYTDVDVSDTVLGHMDYFKPRAYTEGGNCVGEIVDRQL